MRGGDHDRAVGFQRAVGEIGHRRRAQSEIDHVAALLDQTRRQRVEKDDGVRSHVASDHDFARTGEGGEGAADLFRKFGVEVGRIDAANVVGFENSAHENSSVTPLSPPHGVRAGFSFRHGAAPASDRAMGNVTVWVVCIL
ncbi:hypothetical protein SDC9_145200 [bioreactor metagenome]|uniref:Uncharacterized protein n=1 Tax=bioreactor metagenome TaxID=1076179 RepID=A0A645E9D7_9ZZZZ